MGGAQPCPRSGHSAVLLTAGLFVFGGRNARGDDVSDGWILENVGVQGMQGLVLCLCVCVHIFAFSLWYLSYVAVL